MITEEVLRIYGFSNQDDEGNEFDEWWYDPAENTLVSLILCDKYISLYIYAKHIDEVGALAYVPTIELRKDRKIDIESILNFIKFVDDEYLD